MTQSFLSDTGGTPVATTIPSRGSRKRVLSRLFLAVASALSAGLAGAQTRQTIFIETLGVPSGNTNISTYGTNNAPATFDYKGILTYSNGGQGNNNQELRVSSPSSNANGISGASGGGNVFLTSTGTLGFSIESIKAANFTSMQLSFIWRKENAAGTGSIPTISIDYSINNGSSWTTLASGTSTPFAVSAPLTQATTSSSTGWFGGATLALPADAQVDGLMIRFVKSGTVAIRIDDIRLTGLPVTPVLGNLSSPTVARSTTPYTLNVTGSGFNRAMTDRVNATTVGAPSNITVNGVAQTTTYTSASALSAPIDISTPGTYTIGVTTTGAAAASNTKTLTVTAAPVVTTVPASLTDGSVSVTLNGTVNANTLSTTAGFKYGQTSSYGLTVAANESPLSGGAATPVTASINSLSPNVTYHYTATASNADGTTDGNDATFVSPAAMASAPTVGNATITSLDVTLNADANPVGTEYAILETGSGLYVQANGALGATAAWATMAAWGTKTVTGLSGGTSYTFAVVARNSTGTTAATSGTASGTTVNGNSIAINGASFAASYCNAADNTFDVSFTAAGTFNGLFKVQVSDADGLFPANTTSNIIGSGAASPVSVTIPAGYTAGSGYRFRIVNDDPSFTGTDNGSNVAIVAAVTPSVSISTNPGTTVCAGISVTFTATAVNGGTASYAWTKNGSPVGTNSNTYTNAAPADGDVVAVTMTSSIGCVTANGVSDAVTMVVHTTPAPPVPTVTNGCGSATLNAIADPGAPLVYYWQGLSANGNKTDSLATAPYVAQFSGTYYLRAYNSSTGCWSVTSTSVTVTGANIIAAPAISQQPASVSGFASGPATFMATSTGSSARAWQLSTDGGANWTNVPGGAPYSTSYGTTSYLAISSLSASMAGNQYRLQLTGNAPCGNLVSNAATLNSVSAAQAVVFNETVGTTAPTSGGTVVGSYNGFSNGVGLVFSSTTTNKTDARTSQSSLGYANVSGSSGIFMGTAGAFQRDLIISNINTSNYNNLVLSFGMFRSNTAATMVLEVSTDGTNWTPLSFSYPAATSTWTPVVASGTIPSTGNLRIRFTKDGNGDIRLDDIRLAGYFADPATTSLSPSSAYAGDASFTLTVNGSNFQNSGRSVITWNGTPLTTTYVSGSVLTATVSAALVSTAGTATVGVTTTGAVNTSNTQTFTINPRSITLNSISNNRFCNGSDNPLTVQFSTQGTYNGSFYVQRSDATGNFPGNATDNIISSASNGSPITATIPQGLAAGTYKVRVVNSSPVVFSSASGSITVDQSGAATISYPGSPYCTSTGTGTVFFSGTNGGTFSASPAGLVIDATTGDIDLAASADGTYTITYSFAGGTACASSASTQVSIRPTSLIAPVANPVYCAGATTTPINFSGPAGITFNWTNTNTSVGLPSSGTGNIPSYTAVNNGTALSYAYINVLPTGGTDCKATIMAFRITVNPMPTVDAVADQTLCAGATSSAVNFTGNLGTTTYKWTNNNTSIGLRAIGTNNIAPFTVQNNGAVPQTATITVTPYYGACSGTPTSFHINVAPSAGSISYNGSPYCPVGTAYVTHLGTSGGTYSAVPAGLNINASTGAVNLALSQAGAYTVTYTRPGGFCATTATTQITIKPRATVNPIPNPVYCNGEVTAPMPFSGTASNFSWTNDNTSIGLAASGTGTSLPSFTTVNAGPGLQYAYVRVTPLGDGVNTCAGNLFSFRITVNYCPPVTQAGGTGSNDQNARSAAQLTVSPNPARGQVTVQYTGSESGPFNVQLVDGFGQPATRARTLTGNTATIDLSDLRPGAYLLQLVNTRTGATVQKQVIKL